MAISYTITNIKGVAAEPIIEELLFENDTLNKELVTLETDIKAETLFTEASATATLQAYSSGAPSSSGSLDLFDATVTPDKVMFYQEFDPNAIRFSRFKRDMKPGAWECASSEFERVVIGGVYAKNIAAAYEVEFWQGVKSATKTAVAALTPGAGQAAVGATEQAQIAALTASQTDGVLAKMIYNTSNTAGTGALGGRIKVAGTTITASNIKAQYDLIYAAIPAEALAQVELPMIYAPKSHKQMIVAANNVTTDYTKPFNVNADASEVYFNGLRVVFVPLPEKVVIAALKSHLVWATDLTSDFAAMHIDKIANNREDMFIKNITTLTAHVANQRFNVLYTG